MVTNGEIPSIHARRVLVPVANPATAWGLIEMAWKLADDEHGRIFALFVTLTGAEPNNTVYAEIEKIVDEAHESGILIELVTRTAPSVARGILDAAIEHGTTLMVLGFQAPIRGKIELGPVVESIARTTPCDLVVYRNPSHSAVNLDDIERVVLPLDGSDNSKVAARLGLALADVYDAQPMAIYVQTDADLPSWFGLARIEASLVGLANTRRVQRQVVQANDIVSGILARCDRNDLVVLGFSERIALDNWIFGNVAQRILARTPGPVILARRANPSGGTLSQRVTQFWAKRFSPRLTPSERTDVIRHATELSQPGINFIVLMFISSLLGSFGLLQNSAAVIIGAMLVAPLMSPLMSFSVGLLQTDLRLMRTAIVTTLFGVGIGLAVAVFGGLIMPLDIATSEMMSRGQPSLLDMGVALASGLAGAYAVARKDIPSALAGVAIAAALVPPLCTVGLALAFGEFELASGAALLFLTNIVCISLAGSAVFAWLGLRVGRELHTRRQLAISLVVLGLLALPLASTFINVVRTEREMTRIRHVLQDQFSDADVLDIELDQDTISATVRSAKTITRSDVDTAEQALENDLDRNVTLKITYWREIIR